MFNAEIRVDLSAVRHNVALLKAGTSAEVMAVVKADGYGHGMVPCARAALAGGATWLGVATLDEALALRAAGVTAPVLAWLLTPGCRSPTRSRPTSTCPRRRCPRRRTRRRGSRGGAALRAST
jgi:alanine racemase